MEQIRRNKIIYVVGRKGSGKSYLVKTSLIPKFERVYICDPNAEYILDGAHIFTDLDVLLDWLKGAPNDYIVICRFDDDYEYKLLFRWVYQLGNCTIVMEEMNIYVEIFLRTEDEDFKKLTRYSRHRSVNIIGICQRAADTPKLFTSQCDTFISFSQSEPRDLDYIADRFGDTAAEQVQNLGQYEFAQFGEKILKEDRVEKKKQDLDKEFEELKAREKDRADGFPEEEEEIEEEETEDD